MIERITVDGKVWTADHWFEAGLPPCLHDCLDGSEWLYRGSKDYVGNNGRGGSACWALERIFRFPRIEDGLVPLKLAYAAYQRRESEGLPVKPNELLVGCNFLEVLHSNVADGLRHSPVLNMTKKSINSNFYEAIQAASVIKKSPLVDHRNNNYLRDLVTDAITRRSPHSHENFRNVEDAVDAAYVHQVDGFEKLMTAHAMVARLWAYLEETGMAFSFEDLLDQWVASLPVNQERGVSRPGRGDFKKRHFCISLVDEFSWMAESFFYREIAILTTAVFSDTSEDYVRKVHERAQT